MPSLAIDNWLDIEKRFRKLAESSALRGMRLDHQWGDAGEYWSLVGPRQSAEYAEVLAVCGLAGRAFYESLDPDNEAHIEIMKERTNQYKWFRAVKMLGGNFKSELPGWQEKEDGTKGYIYSGSSHSFVETSANLCLNLASESPIEDNRGFFESLFQDYGKQLFIGVFLTLFGGVVGWFLKG